MIYIWIKTIKTCENKDELFTIRVYEKHDHVKTYPINFIQSDSDNYNCSTFSDTEWIVTYYNLKPSNNAVLNCFFDAIRMLHEHLQSLVPYKCDFVANVNDKDKNIKINRIYHKPGTSLYYLVSIFLGNNIKDKLKRDFQIDDVAIVPQMTFGCDVEHVFGIIHQLLIYSKRMVMEIEKSKDKYTHFNAEDIEEQFIAEYSDFINIDVLTNMLFTTYNLYNSKGIYLFNKTDQKSRELFKIIKNYFRLIIYKVFVYLNNYLRDKSNDDSHFFKLNLTIC